LRRRCYLFRVPSLFLIPRVFFFRSPRRLLSLCCFYLAVCDFGSVSLFLPRLENGKDFLFLLFWRRYRLVASSCCRDLLPFAFDGLPSVILFRFLVFFFSGKRRFATKISCFSRKNTSSCRTQPADCGPPGGFKQTDLVVFSLGAKKNFCCASVLCQGTPKEGSRFRPRNPLFFR